MDGRSELQLGGVPMINIMLLGPRGGVQFYDIRSAAGVTKDYSFFFNLHKQIVEELEPADKWRILGM
eukprot:330882-Chlamydomonas_euryale.AAC.1